MTEAVNASTGKRRRSTRAQTRERLLDAAESLFAAYGFHAVPVRDIVKLAGTRLADINDHFGGKEELFRDVITRRATLINSDRAEGLAKLSAFGEPRVRIRAVVEAFTAPMLARSKEGDGWENYLKLIAQISTTRSSVLLLIADQFNPIAARFIDQIQAIFPDMSQRQRLNAYQFMVSAAVTVFSNNYRVDSLSDGTVHSADFDQHYVDLIDFIVGGIMGINQSAG
jgi:AcrR family transcriptional regulator